MNRLGASPFVSVGIPVRNEAHSIAALLESLLCQSHPPDEILVADGGSIDNTVDIAQRYADRGVRILHLGPAFPGRGRNAAILAARNDWIALIDAGCIADHRWLENLLSAVTQTDGTARVVFGNYRPRLQTEWDIAQALTIVPPIDHVTGCRSPFIASSLVHRSAWRQVGGFPEDLRAAEDLLFFRRIEASDVTTAWSPNALIEWDLADGVMIFFRRLRLYSAHHLLSGLSSTWHKRVILMDGVAASLAVGALAWPPAALALLAFGMARVVRSIVKRRANIGSATPFRPARLARVAVLLVLADIATWLGVWDYITGRASARRRSIGSR